MPGGSTNGLTSEPERLTTQSNSGVENFESHVALNDSAPRVFALLERTDPESGELELYAWGVEVGGSANVFQSDGHVLAHCGSAEGARRMFGIIRDVVLVWPGETNRIE
ncbi:hypothetical protein SAMN04487905_106100 [Actinopolyspora xinjiangensis]|uniref:Prepilin-type processing-associated H-X9-DG domain-containing protein n=1 Tax=Actinopolyspora xinjiangensis TaxID=405564 RepID=A0A1H0U8E1_9ACTN|nr:hypothetical protein [Actinopolyspora xinjiangensis]SDP62096.1 hypothetical protein SAMN04487905_106100 [Actinopolyspora xinjiangensis]